MIVWSKIHIEDNEWIVKEQKEVSNILDVIDVHRVGWQKAFALWGLYIFTSFENGVKLAVIVIDTDNKEFLNNPFLRDEYNDVDKILELRGDIISKIRDKKLSEIGI